MIRSGFVALAAILLALAGAAPGSRAASSSYVAVDLGPLGGGFVQTADVNDRGQVVGAVYTAGSPASWHAFSWTQADGVVYPVTPDTMNSGAQFVTDAGQVVGYAYISSFQWHAFSWTQAGGMVDLGTLGDGSSGPNDVNEHGQIVGQSNALTGPVLHAFSWTEAGGMIDLGSLGGTGTTYAWAVSDAGQVVGQSSTVSGFRHAFSWTPTGGMVDLGTLGGVLSSAADVNDTGQVVGASLTSTAALHAYVWTQGGGMVDLGTLGGTSSSAKAVNDAGQVIGTSTTASGDTRVFSWTPEGGMIDIGTLGGATSTLAGSTGAHEVLNASGQVVGSSTTAAGETHAFSWTQAGGMVDLGTLGGTSSNAYAVSDTGFVVGTSALASGEWHATLWKPSDTTAPTLTVPAGVTVDATSARGVAVVFPATATDETDPSPVVTCSPASGSIFPIGDTTVSCAASDAAGNTATASFVVHVRGAGEQLAELAVRVTGVGPGHSLAAKVTEAQRSNAQGRTQETCDVLAAFSNEVRAQSGKKIPTEQATALIADATRIRNVVGCTT